MNLRNLTILRFPVMAIWFDQDALQQQLGEATLKPVGPLELASHGFTAPHGRNADNLCPSVGAATWLTVGSETRLLPGSVVNDLLAKKLAEIEQKEGRKPGGRARKALKDQLITELLPRAFVKPGRTDALVDTDRGLLVVDSSSRKAGEEFASEIRRALGSFPALPINAEVAPRAVLTGWVAGEPLPDGLQIGDECELQDPVGEGTVRITNMELQGDEVARHLEAGKQVTRLALVLDDRVSFVLGEDLVVRKFRLLDTALDSLASTDADDLAAELDARLALAAGEVGRLFDVLETALKISKVEAA